MGLSKKLSALLAATALLASLLTGCGQTAPKTAETTMEPAVTVPAGTAREGVKTLLAVSLRDFSPADSAPAFRNSNQADMLMLLVVDEKLGRTTGVQVNPDTMVSFTPPGKTEAVEVPLGEVYSYGSAGSDSCLALLKAVSELLGGVKIDHYMIFAQGAIGIVSDAMGGLEVTVSEDFSARYPQFAPGELATLNAEQADAFFGFRDDADESNRLHMARQQQFMTAVYGPFTEHMQQEDFLTRLTMQLGDRLMTDLALSQMVKLMEKMEATELVETIVTLPGSGAWEDGRYSYRVDAAALDQILKELFY